MVARLTPTRRANAPAARRFVSPRGDSNLSNVATIKRIDQTMHIGPVRRRPLWAMANEID
jgi:hypothetical protein